MLLAMTIYAGRWWGMKMTTNLIGKEIGRTEGNI